MSAAKHVPGGQCEECEGFCLVQRPKQLKYVRTTQGFMVFPCLVTTHKSAAGSSGWPILSAGLIDWDHDGRPLCMGQSDTLGISARPDDTDALRGEWGMGNPHALLAAAQASIAYDAAIQSCANNPELMASFCTAQGENLDALYGKWISLSRTAVAQFTGSAS